MFKKLRKNIQIISFLGYSSLSTVDKSLRFTNINYKSGVTPVIYAVWHGWQYGLLGIKGQDRKNLNLLISQSRDGKIISNISSKLGYSIINGSTGKNGTKAMINILKTLKENKNIAYTVDGSKGPIFHVKEGIIKIAQLSQVPIVPLVPATNWKITAKSWDKYKVPMHFAKIINVFGDPIHIPKDLKENELEKYRLLLEKKLFSLQEEAEERLKSNYTNFNTQQVEEN